MTRTISTPELKSNLETILNRIAEEREPYVIETAGKPAAVLLSTEEYDELKREWAWSIVDKLRAQNAHRDPDEIYEEVTKIVEEVRQELYDEWQASGRSS
jgi:prevent-host-death family protein